MLLNYGFECLPTRVRHLHPDHGSYIRDGLAFFFFGKKSFMYVDDHRVDIGSRHEMENLLDDLFWEAD
jgi:hypothetical protein